MEENNEKNEQIVEAEEVVTPTSDQEEIVSLEKELGVSKQTYKEFFDLNGGIWGQIKSTLIMCLCLCLIIYLIDHKNKEFPVMFMEMGIYCGILIVVTVIFNLITRLVITPKQYVRSGIDKMRIVFKFSNLGIRQIINEQTVLVHWTSFVKGVETNNSFFFIGSNKRGLLFSKDELSNDEILIIRGLAEANLGSLFNLKIKDDK